jgi:hypothetical protein
VTVAPDTVDALRGRLLDLRDDLVEQLADADVLDGGMLALLGDVGTALAALDATALAPVFVSQDEAARRRRGGDPHAEKRAERDAALRELAATMGDDVPVERRAREIATRMARYRPAAEETSDERLLMRQIIDTGLAVPKPDRLKRIIKTG